MKKQTVEERYGEQQIMTGKIYADQKPSPPEKTDVRVKQILKQTEQALRQAYQSVQQAELAFPSLSHLELANDRLQYATDNLHQLETIKPKLIVGFPKNTEQQLVQLKNEVKQATKTLQLIQSSETNS